ncbi:OB-fold nucleic acid binding domain-containing protein [Halospeciosus flavus]|uniref:OB-fold nucleic acid binding domain-containing protein n=1 Tax=Halospeciosus flavus TaxID=3032283 RepID=UPI003605C427
MSRTSRSSGRYSGPTRFAPSTATTAPRKVSNVLLGDETGRVRVTLWDEKADLSEEFEVDETVEVVDGYVRERDGSLELHVGNRGTVERVDEDVEFVPAGTPIETLEIGDTTDIAGVVRSVDEKRTFDRDDGSEGQVRNVRLQDETGDLRVAMWGEKADLDIGPGDEVLFTDVEIQDGWQDDIEASAGWQTTVIELEDGATTAEGDAGGSATSQSASRGQTQSQGLDAFEDGESPSSSDADATESPGSETKTAAAAGAGGETETTEVTEFTGVVVQAGSPVILDDGEETMSVDTDADVTLGEEITVSGTLQDGRLDADEVR